MLNFFLRILTVETGFVWIENIEFNIELGWKGRLWVLMTCEWAGGPAHPLGTTDNLSVSP